MSASKQKETKITDDCVQRLHHNSKPLNRVEQNEGRGGSTGVACVILIVNNDCYFKVDVP